MELATIRRLAGWFLILCVWSAAAAEAAAPSPDQALKLLPVQPGVDFSRPTAEQVAKCTIHARKIDGRAGWIVEDPDGLVLRKFVDTNGDNVVDQWSYYKDGLEVYRDIDANFNGKADQYRWFLTAGSRWGLDNDEDGQIDTWKTISAEEVTAEVVAALAERDVRRFTRLTLTPGELKSLGLGPERAAKLADKIAKLAADFKGLATTQKSLTPQTQWVQFSGTRPGLVPAGTDGSSQDIVAYENVVAIVQTGETHGQVQIGTLVKVGDVWRVIDLPQVAPEGQAEVAASGFFFQASMVRRSPAGAVGTEDESQKLLAELEELDKTADQATTPQKQAELNARRAELLRKIADASRRPEDRAMWLRQLADMVSAAVQSGTYAEGMGQLEGLLKELKDSQADKDLAAYVKFRQLTAAYGLGLQAPKADFAKVQAQWLKDLEQYVADYPTSPDAAEAMLQMAIAQEFAGEENEAKQWYGRVVQSFPNSPAAKKASGLRLESVGKTIALRGKSPEGAQVDLAKYRGRVVLIQYWATWCEPCKRDIPVLKQLVAKYPRELTVIGVSLDRDRKELVSYLAANRLGWPQIFEEGGLDSAPANQLGILTLPTMILVDKQGKVVDRNVQSADLEATVEKLVR
jgi:thiol-disulfide isomerase/thioredoxin